MSTTLSTPRSEVYAALDGERDYQEQRWNRDTTTSGGQHRVEEWLIYIQDYTLEAMHHVSRTANPAGSDAALHTIRKIGAMCVACMEQNGAPRREA